MDFSKRDSRERIGLRALRLNLWLWLLTGVWSGAVVGSFAWNIAQLRHHTLEQARNELRANFFKDLTLRQWATGHGGIYVPVSDKVKPDPFTAFLPERDVVTPSGRVLTLINPAAMLRQLYELGKQTYGAHGHISSLRPLNPENQPDEWERAALAAFAGEGEREISEVSDIGAEPYLRLIRPLFMSEQCLQCHDRQGYQPGEVGGAVSVSVPLSAFHASEREHLIVLGAGHGLLWLLGFAGLRTAARQLSRRVEERERAYLALTENDERMRAVLDTSLDAIITIDANDYITGWNRQAESIFGWATEEVIGRRLADTIVPTGQRRAHLDGIRRVVESGRSDFLNRRIEMIAVDRTGREFPVELALASFRSNGAIVFSAFVRDISERKQAQAKMERDYHSQRILAAVLETSLEPSTFKEKLERILALILSTPWLSLQAKGAVFTVDGDTSELILSADQGLSTSVRKGCARVAFGECICGRTAASARMLFVDSIDERHDRVYEDMTPHGHYCLPIMAGERLLGVLTLYVEEQHRSSEDEIRFLSAVAHTLGGVIQRHQAQEQLSRYAYYDQLTGLPNRTLFHDRLQQAAKRALHRPSCRFAVLFLDLDRFKNINDSLGHAAGDALLKVVAERLAACLRPEDSIGRLGGDEFAVLMEQVYDIADPLRVAQRIHRRLAEPLDLADQEVFSTVSIGVVLSDGSRNESPSDLLRAADTAMYRAKARGPGQTEVFDERMHASVAARLSREMEIRRALERNDFEVHYQPIVSAASRGISGFEALLRWPHRDGNIPPAEFIPIAEETGLINELGQWVLESACRQLQTWQAKGLASDSTYVSVNLSIRQFFQRDFLSFIDAVLGRYQIPPRSLRFELTESVFMENLETAPRLLADLKRRGVCLYIDDFGTGYSSLSYLHRFPFDALKIDRSFVAKLGGDEKHDAMVRSIIAIAHSFEMHVIAEGVETPEQLAQLARLGCAELQGYHFSPAVPAHEAERLLARDWGPKVTWSG